MLHGAGISTDGLGRNGSGLYRYWLTRKWGEGPTSHNHKVCFCPFNPSWADGTKEDPTLTRMINFAQAWGYGELIVVNMYAYRTEDPDELIAAAKRGVDVIGPDNAHHLAYAFYSSQMVIACWGANKFGRQRAFNVMVAFPDVPFFCIRRTKSGAPEHPLYLPGDLKPVLYRGA